MQMRRKLHGDHHPVTPIALDCTLPARYIALLAGTFVITFDFFVVNLALAAIRSDLHASGAQIQWISGSFGLAYGTMLIPASRFGERYGPIVGFRAGLILFLAGSAASALAPDAITLIAWRALQGVGAACLSPQVMALLGRLKPEPVRLRGFAGYGAALGLGSGLGQLVGGLIVDPAGLDLSWRVCFLVNLPLGLWAVWTTRGQTGREHGRRDIGFDPIGTLGLLAAMLGLIVPLIEGRRLGWPPVLLAVFVAALALLWWLVRRTRNRAGTGRTTLVDPAVLSALPFRYALLSVLCFYSANASFFFVISLYLQLGRALSPLPAAGVFSVMVAGFLATGLGGRRVSARLGSRSIRIGALIMMIGQAILALQVARGTDLSLLAPTLLLTGAGTGIVMGPMIARAIATAGSAQVQAAAGLVGSAQWIGNALGVAVFGSIFFAFAPPEAARAQFADAAAICHLGFAMLGAVVALSIRAWEPGREQA